MAFNVGTGKVPGKSILDTPGKSLADTKNFIQNPFSQEVPNTRPKPDFTNGFNIVEIIDGVKQEKERVRLIGTWMPKQPFNFGGMQRNSKEFYPGNSEPVVQLFGPEEKDLVIDGTINAKNLKISGTTLSKEKFRTVSTEIQQQLDAIRIRGNLVELTMGEWRRFGFLTDSDFKVRTLADLDYSITFMIIGFNPPLNCNQIDTEAAVPFDINKNLIALASAFEATHSSAPNSVPQSIGDVINGVVSDIAGAIGAVTGFVDGTLSVVEDVTGSLNRAVGVVRYAQAEISRGRRRIGLIKLNDINGGSTRISNFVGYSFVNDLIGSTWSLSAYLATLLSRFEQLRETVPLARHRVVEGETLQKIAIKFYNNSGDWEKIYDHNGLNSTDLIAGDVLEIPQV